jgi:flagellar biosynthesis/type III secretory pathway protein FliH
MTNEQILELAKTCGFDDFTGEKENFWECWEEQLLKFALAIHEDGYNKGYGEGWREGYDVGVIEYSND